MEFRDEQNKSAIEYGTANVSLQGIEDGTEDNPFLVFDLESLNRIRNNLKCCYKLTADIDLKGVEFSPIGSQSIPFTGVFDGDGHTVMNFKVKSVSTYAGIFAYAKSAVIRNIRFENVVLSNSKNYAGCVAGYLNMCTVEYISLFNIKISGNQYIGGLAGYMVGGTVRYCSAQKEISVNGTNWVGGLIGMMEKNAAKMEVCCMKGSVTGGKNVGGLIGYANDTISNSYAVGNVTSVSNDMYTGGLIGYAAQATIANCFAACKVSQGGSGLVYGTNAVTAGNSFYDIQTAPAAMNNSLNVGKLTAAMTRKDTFKSWNLTAKWNIEEGNTYPYLRAVDTAGVIPVKVGIQTGAGTKENPYLIDNVAALNCVRYELQACYQLTADIDLGGAEFVPIGSKTLPFAGRFYGDGHTIKNFKITGNGNYVGMFGCAKSAVISSVKLEQETVVNAQNYTGGLAGYLEACTVENVSLAGVGITGKLYTGGLAGNVYGGTIRACAAQEESVVSGTNYVGGLIGQTENGTKVETCCVKGKVTGADYLGGLIGSTSNTVNNTLSNSYIIGSVTSASNRSYVGGLVGSLTGTITNSYASCKVSQRGNGLMYPVSGSVNINSYYDSQVAGVLTPNGWNVGKLTTAMTQKEAFQGWDFETVWNIEEGNTYPYLRAVDTAGVTPVKVGIQTGAGTKENPYLIDSAAALNCVRYELQACYQLTADIDLSGAEFVPIGSPTLPFAGRFHGDGHTIKNFKITGNGNYVGMFGCAKSAVISSVKLEQETVVNAQNYTGGLAGYLEACTVENVSLAGVCITGKLYTGGLAGYVYGGTIRACATQEESVVSGTNYVGGLIGQTENGLKVETCCVKGKVTGADYLGGLIGSTSNTVNNTLSNSYVIGSVTSASNYSNVGGLAGRLTGTVTNSYASCKVSQRGNGLMYPVSGSVNISSYYDSQVAGAPTPNGWNVGKLTTAMTQKEAFQGWDFETVWNIEEGNTYPYLRAVDTAGVTPVKVGVQSGAGTKENPYLIDNAASLNCVRYELQACYQLTADIDLGGAEFVPIGSVSLPFTGGFNGNGHTVNNFIITKVSAYAGMFGFARSAVISSVKLEQETVVNTQYYTGGLAGYLEACTVENVSLAGVSITGNQYTGGLAGNVYGGTIKACAAQEDTVVSGTNYVGGLIGQTENGLKVETCCVKGKVTGADYLGGLIGSTSNTVNNTLSNSYVIGSVTSASNYSNVGGLAGRLTGTVTNSYASCKVSQRGNGLMYPVSGSVVTSSYFDSSLTNITTPAAQARTTEQMLNKATFIGWDWDHIWIHEEASYPRLRIVEAINQEPFQLTFRSLTYSSVIIEWPQIKGAKDYEVSYQGKTVKVSEPVILIQDLMPDTNYDIKVWATIGEVARLWSKTLSIRTKKVLSFTGLHCTAKGEDTITLTWNPLEDAEYYEVYYDNNFGHHDMQRTESNACMLAALQRDQPCVISVRAVLNNGSTVISSPIIEKLYALNPQTEYAAAFIANCQGQTWFMDEVENLLNQKGKSISSINSRNDLAAIYAIGLADSGISGTIPTAIGELYCLQYLYLANNDLGGSVPEVLSKMEHLIEMDLSGNHFIS